MQSDVIVELLADAEAETIRVTDADENEWRAHVDSVVHTPLAQSRYDDEGELSVITDVPDDWWDECPSESYSPEIYTREDDGDWHRPSAIYNIETDDERSVEIDSVEVLEG